MNLWYTLRNSRIAQIIGGVVILIGIVVLISAGVSILAGLLLAFLVGISIYFGSIMEISGSALLAVLLKIVGGTAKQFIAIFWASPKVDQFFKLVDTTGYTVLILTFFLFAHAVSFTTGRIKIFHVKNSTTNNYNKEKEQKEKGGKQ